MGNWHVRHWYLALLGISILWFVWAAAAQGLYGGSKDLNVISECQKHIEKRMAEYQRLERHLDLARSGGRGDMAVYFSRRLDEIRDEIRHIDAALNGNSISNVLPDLCNDDTFANLTICSKGCLNSAYVILTGNLLLLLSSMIITYWIVRAVLDPRVKVWRVRRQVLEKEFDAILSDTSRWPRDQVYKALLQNGATRLKKQLERLESQRRERRPAPDETDWRHVAKVLFNAAKILHNAKPQPFPLHVAQDTLRDQYFIARKIVTLDAVVHLLKYIAWPLLILIVYETALQTGKPINILDDINKEYGKSIIFALGGWILAVIVYYITDYGVRWWTEKSSTEIDDIIVSIVSMPLALATAILVWGDSVSNLPGHVKYLISYALRSISNSMGRIFVFGAILTWLVIFVFNKLIIYALDQWTKRTRQKYDDMFVRILQIFGTFLIVTAAVGLVLLRFQTEIRRTTGIDNVLLPYSIVVSVITAIIGYSAKEGIENFFGGILLQVDKPFDVGERLVLETGELCDVREIGMRSTVLYNVLENTEVHVPNRVMSNSKIVNVSRPDFELRVPVAIYLPFDGTSLRLIEAILLDIAYFEPEVDQARVAPREVSQQLRTKGRMSLLEHMEHLYVTYPEIVNVYSERILGRGGFDSTPVFPEIIYTLQRITFLRSEKYGRAVQEHYQEIFEESKIPGYSVSHLAKFTRYLFAETERITRSSSSRAELVDKINVLLPSISTSFGIDNKDVYTYLKNIADRIKDKYNKKGAPDNDIVDQLNIVGAWLKETDRRRYESLIAIRNEFHIFAEFLHSIGDIYPGISGDLDPIVAEFNKEPSVVSKFHVAEDGSGYIEVILRIFATHLERREALNHKLYKDIIRRFKFEGVRMLHDHPRSQDRCT